MKEAKASELGCGCPFEEGEKIGSWTGWSVCGGLGLVAIVYWWRGEWLILHLRFKDVRTLALEHRHVMSVSVRYELNPGIVLRAPHHEKNEQQGYLNMIKCIS
jgi:hypothetical protein